MKFNKQLLESLINEETVPLDENYEEITDKDLLEEYDNMKLISKEYYPIYNHKQRFTVIWSYKDKFYLKVGCFDGENIVFNTDECTEVRPAEVTVTQYIPV